MSQSWYYAKNNERRGPVPLAELRSLVAQGGLQPSDLVWSEHLPGWVPARKVRELFPAQPADSVPGVRVPATRNTPSKPAATTVRSVTAPAPSPSREPASSPGFDWNDLRPRHWIAGGGAFLAALGIAFTAIARSPVTLAFTVGGLALAALGLYVEIGRLLAQATENIEPRSWPSNRPGSSRLAGNRRSPVNRPMATTSPTKKTNCLAAFSPPPAGRSSSTIRRSSGGAPAWPPC